MHARFSLVLAAALTLTPLAAQEKDPVLSEFFQANALYNKRLYPLASDSFRAFLDKHGNHPKAPAARLGLALSLAAQGKHADAEPFLAELYKNANLPEAAHVALTYAGTLAALGKHADAAKAYAEAATRKGTTDQLKLHARTGLLDSLHQQKKWPEVIRETAEILKTNPPQDLADRLRTRSAFASFELGDYKTAASTLGVLGARDAELGQQGLFFFAECQRQLGDRNAARQGFERARRLDGPYTAEALFRLGFMNFEDRNWNGTINHLNDLLKNHAGSPLAQSAPLYLGRAYFERNDLRRARENLSKVDSAAAQFWLARCFTKENKPADATRLLKAATAKFPGDLDLQFELANALLQANDFPAAAAAFANVASADGYPHLATAAQFRAYCLHRSGDFNNSLAACNDFANRVKDPTPEAAAAVAFLKSENLFLLDRVDEALAAANHFVSRHGNHPDANTARLRIAQVHYRKQRWPEAADAFKQLVARNPKREHAFASLDFYAAEASTAAGRGADARRHYEHFINTCARSSPDRPVALANLAALHAKENRTGDAIHRYEQLANEHRDHPSRPTALLEIGRLAYAAKDHGKTRHFLDILVREHAGHELRPQADYTLGYLALAEKRNPDARRHFAAVTAAPDNIIADARLQVALLATAANDLPTAEKALAEIDTSHIEPAKIADLRLHIGVAQARQKRYADARETLGQLVTSNPPPATKSRAHYELAWCARNLGDNAAAMKEYTGLLASKPDQALAGTANIELAELEHAAGKHDEAIARLAPLTSSPDAATAARAHYRTGWCKFAQKKWSESAASFDQVLQRADHAKDLVATAAYQAGEAKRELRDYPAAAALYDRSAAGTDPAIAQQSMVRIAETRALAGDYSASLAACDNFVAKFPQSELLRRIRFARGWALENLARHSDAIAAYTHVLSANINDETAARAQFQIGECHLAANDYDRAIKALIKVETDFGNNQWTPKAILEIGTALERKKDPENARARYTEVIKKFPDTPTARVAQQRLETLDQN